MGLSRRRAFESVVTRARARFARVASSAARSSRRTLDAIRRASRARARARVATSASPRPRAREFGGGRSTWTWNPPEERSSAVARGVAMCAASVVAFVLATASAVGDLGATATRRRLGSKSSIGRCGTRITRASSRR